MTKILLTISCLLNVFLIGESRRDAVADFARSKTSDQTVYYIFGGIATFLIIFIVYTALKRKK